MNFPTFPPKETSPSRMGRFGLGYFNMMSNKKLQQDKINIIPNLYFIFIKNFIRLKR